MAEIYLDNGKLIAIDAWKEMVLALKNEVSNKKEETQQNLEQTWMHDFEKAIIERVGESIKNAKDKKIGVLFSGGLDSSLIALVLAKHNIPFICYTAGYQDKNTKEPDDIIESKKIAAHYGWDLKIKTLENKELRKVIHETADSLGNNANPVSVTIGAVILAAAKVAKNDGVTQLFGGLGSEEIFAGYKRHKDVKNITDECWRGTINMYDRDLIRDCKIAKYLGVTVHTPFLDKEVIITAMRFSDKTKIENGENKAILRKMAVEIGLEHQFASRPKKAAQYGSRINKGLLRLAWEEGLDKKGDFLEKLSKQPL